MSTESNSNEDKRGDQMETSAKVQPNSLAGVAGARNVRQPGTVPLGSGLEAREIGRAHV